MTEPPFEELIERHLAGLHAFVRLKAGPGILCRESTSDLVQSVCRELLEHRDRFVHGGEEGFRRWLHVEALRKIHDRYRRQFAQKRDLGREIEKSGAWLDACDAFGTPSRHAAGREELERLESAFAELSDEEQNVILWSRFCGLKHDEIAEAIGKTPVATRKVLSRALAKLAEWLDEGD